MPEKTITKKITTRKPASKTPTTRKPRATAAKASATKSAPVAEVTVEKKAKAISKASSNSFYAVGKRKTSVAQILLTEGEGTITLNKLTFEQYFQTEDLRHIALQPLVSVGVEKQLNVQGKIHGGGIHSQAEALRHAISRALIQYNPESRRQLKKQGFLTRDPRVKERKKPGLKRARRAPQFSKR